MKHRKATAETVFYDGCGCVSTPESRARKHREANELRSLLMSIPR